MEDQEFTQAVLYRLVYGRARERLGRYYAEQSHEAVRADPLEGLGLDPAMVADPQTAETIREATEDAISGRSPRW